MQKNSFGEFNNSFGASIQLTSGYNDAMISFACSYTVKTKYWRGIEFSLILLNSKLTSNVEVVAAKNTIKQASVAKMTKLFFC